jgi:hypothetical protein
VGDLLAQKRDEDVKLEREKGGQRWLAHHTFTLTQGAVRHVGSLSFWKGFQGQLFRGAF